MVALLDECRRNLEESLDYLAEYWREDLDLDPDDMDKRLEEIDPELFAQEDSWRHHLEEQYLNAVRKILTPEQLKQFDAPPRPGGTWVYPADGKGEPKFIPPPDEGS